MPNWKSVSNWETALHYSRWELGIDTDAQEVLIERWFPHNAPMNQKHYHGTSRIVGDIQSAELQNRAREALDDAWKASLENQEVRLMQNENERPLSPLEKRQR
jgi:hypothetical protein